MKERIIFACALISCAAWGMVDDYAEALVGAHFYYDGQIHQALEEFKSGQLAIKRKLIEDALAQEGYTALIAEMKEHKTTPFTYAISEDACNDLLQKCLAKDVPLLTENTDEQTPLYLAVRYKAVANLKTLIFYMQKKYGHSYVDMLNQKIKACDGGSILHQAVGKNNVEIVCTLLQFPLDVNQQDDRGNTPLHVIDLERDFKTNKEKAKQIIKLLLVAGANPTIRNSVLLPFTLADYEPEFQHFTPAEYMRDMGKTISQLRSTPYDPAEHITSIYEEVASFIERVHHFLTVFRNEKMNPQSFISVLPREIFDEGCKFIAETFEE